MHEEERLLLHQSRSAESETLNVEEGTATGELGWQTPYYLQGSHFLSAWGQRMWEFAVGLVSVCISPNSVTPYHTAKHMLHMCSSSSHSCGSTATWVQIMLDLGLGSLTLVSAFGLLDGLTVVIAGPLVGDWIDRHVPLRPLCSLNLPNLICVVHCSLQALLKLQD